MSRTIRTGCGLSLLILAGALAVLAFSGNDHVRLVRDVVRERMASPEVRRQLERERQRRYSDELWMRERRDMELRAEAMLRTVPITPCNQPVQAGRPQLCLKLAGSAEFPFGQPVPLRLAWRNLPQGAYIRVWAESAAPAGTRFLYAGPTGAITAESFGGKPAGEAGFVWDGKSVYCAPADLPMMCDAGQVGKFVLHAEILTGSDPFWPSWPPQHPVPVRHLAMAAPVVVTITGPPRPFGRPGEQIWSSLLRQAVREGLIKATPKGMLPEPFYYDRLMERTGPWEKGWFSYCTSLKLTPPLAGTMSICFPRSRRDDYGLAVRRGDISVSGTPREAPAR
ncbi:MAG: hypothetical protein ABIO86_12680 [Sphingomonas sp.]